MPSFMQDREQADRRRSIKRKDDYGRVWHCVIDVHDDRMGHCGPPTLDGKYLPPIDIPLKYLKKLDPEDQFRQVIDIARWKADWRDRMVTWKARLVELAQIMYPNDFGEKVENPTADLLREAGPMPIPLEFIEAIEVGNKWALGIPKADGTYYKRPSWASDELWARYQLLKQSFWMAGQDAGAMRQADPSMYPDEEDEVEAAEPVAVGAAAYADDEDETPKPKGRRGR
jgi:hypothetical protein